MSAEWHKCTCDCEGASIYSHSRWCPCHPNTTAHDQPQCRAIALTLHAGGNTCILRQGHVGEHKTWRGDQYSRHVMSVCDMYDEIVKLCPCTEHKRYKAKRAPKIACEGCWRLWVLTHPGYDLETRWMR